MKLEPTAAELELISALKTQLKVKWVLLTQKRRELIQARLDEGATQDMLLAAIAGAANDTFCREHRYTRGGVNAASFENIFRDLETVERYANQQGRGKKLVPALTKEQTRQIARDNGVVLDDE